MKTPEQTQELQEIMAASKGTGAHWHAFELWLGKDPTGGMVPIDSQIAALRAQVGLTNTRERTL